MKISQALSRFILLTYALANTTTTLAKPTYVPPMYDGYVDARSIRPRQPNLLHVDGTILAREERGVDEGDHIASRQWEAVLLLVIVASAIVTSVIAPIIISIEEDDPRRTAYTQGVVQGLYANSSAFNYVICHTDHDFWFDGTQGTDWNHLYQEFPISLGRTIGYDIYWFRSGTFRRWGDGGFINWAYLGNVQSRSYGSPDVVVFSPE